jgi:hypothetical protein
MSLETALGNVQRVPVSPLIDFQAVQVPHHASQSRIGRCGELKAQFACFGRHCRGLFLTPLPVGGNGEWQDEETSDKKAELESDFPSSEKIEDIAAQ